jgi:hypothetical protein
MFPNNKIQQPLIPITEIDQPEDQSVEKQGDNGGDSPKTLLENYYYNALMTVFQDLPQTIATAVVMSTTGLTEAPDNPTGVSLPGYLNLIPQSGNTIAGFAIGLEAMRLITVCREKRTCDNLMMAVLYTIFSVSIVLNGTTNISTTLLDDKASDRASSLSLASTLIALSANFLILCREEIKLLNKLHENIEKNEHIEIKKNGFHTICSLLLNLSIITAFLATTKLASREVGAYGYFIGTWLGQVPELIDPTVKKFKSCNPRDYCRFSRPSDEENPNNSLNQVPNISTTSALHDYFHKEI